MNEGKSNLLDYVSSSSAFGSRAKHKLLLYSVYNLLTRNNEWWRWSWKTSFLVTKIVMAMIIWLN